MAVYDRQIASAKRMIAKYGQKVQWSQNRAVEGAKSWKPENATPVKFENVPIAFLPVSKEMRETYRTMRGAEVPQGCVMGLMPQQAFKPNMKDTVKRGNAELRIEYIDELAPNGRDILYTILFLQ